MVSFNNNINNTKCFFFTLRKLSLFCSDNYTKLWLQYVHKMLKIKFNYFFKPNIILPSARSHKTKCTKYRYLLYFSI